jgi:hypothetical protein
VEVEGRLDQDDTERCARAFAEINSEIEQRLLAEAFEHLCVGAFVGDVCE